MNVGDLVQVAQHPDKWFRVEELTDDGQISKLEDVTTAIERALRKHRSNRSRFQRIAEQAMQRLNA